MVPIVLSMVSHIADPFFMNDQVMFTLNEQNSTPVASAALGERIGER